MLKRVEHFILYNKMVPAFVDILRPAAVEDNVLGVFTLVGLELGAVKLLFCLFCLHKCGCNLHVRPGHGHGSVQNRGS